MRATQLTLGVALCVLLDFSTPFIGGAFTFSADECAEGLGVDRQHALPIQPAATLPTDTVEVLGPEPQRRSPAPPAPARGLGGARRTPLTRSEAPPPPGEEH